MLVSDLSLNGRRKSGWFGIALAMVLFACAPMTIAQTPTPDIRLFCSGNQCPCFGDCNQDDTVTIDELLTMVNVALEAAPLNVCHIGDKDGDHAISVDEILFALRYAQDGCPDTPGFCSKCRCEFVSGTGTLTLEGAVPSCTEPCAQWCEQLSGCGGLISTSCSGSGSLPSVDVPR
jgi:hypothetical protein